MMCPIDTCNQPSQKVVLNDLVWDSIVLDEMMITSISQCCSVLGLILSMLHEFNSHNPFTSPVRPLFLPPGIKWWSWTLSLAWGALIKFAPGGGLGGLTPVPVCQVWETAGGLLARGVGRASLEGLRQIVIFLSVPSLPSPLSSFFSSFCYQN